MKPAQRLTAIIEREDDGFVALCPELDIASEGASIEEARTNLIEALTLFFETAAPSEVAQRFHREVFVTQAGWVSFEFSRARRFAGFSNKTDSPRSARTRSLPNRQISEPERT